MHPLLSRYCIPPLTHLPVTPLVNLFSTQQMVVDCDAPQHNAPHNERATRYRGGAYAIGGVALNAAGAVGALALMPIVGPSALAGVAAATCVGSAMINDHFVRNAGIFDPEGYTPRSLQRPLRAAAWTVSHVAMGTSMGLTCGTLPFLSAARLATGLAIGVGIPVLTYLVQLMRRDAAPNEMPLPSAWHAFLRPVAIIDADISPLFVPIFFAGWMAGSHLPMRPENYLTYMTLSGAVLCAASTTFSTRRAHQLATHAHRIDPAASSLLLSSAVVTSALWGCNVAAIRFKSVFSVAISERRPTLTGRGLRRSAQRRF